MTRVKSRRWWLESTLFVGAIAAFVLWQGHNWKDLSEAQAIALVAALKVLESFRGGEG